MHPVISMTTCVSPHARKAGLQCVFGFGSRDEPGAFVLLVSGMSGADSGRGALVLEGRLTASPELEAGLVE